jgi:hypothetical protein
MEHHWCIADGCTHGTINGSISLGSLFMREYNAGYAAGYNDAEIDRKDIQNLINAAMAWYDCANDDPICKEDSKRALMKACYIVSDKEIRGE